MLSYVTSCFGNQSNLEPRDTGASSQQDYRTHCSPLKLLQDFRQQTENKYG